MEGFVDGLEWLGCGDCLYCFSVLGVLSLGCLGWVCVVDYEGGEVCCVYGE